MSGSVQQFAALALAAVTRARSLFSDSLEPPPGDPSLELAAESTIGCPGT
jgi:hypothetical protein